MMEQNTPDPQCIIVLVYKNDLLLVFESVVFIKHFLSRKRGK